MSERLRVGVIGAGVGKAHLAGYRACPEAELIALCDMDAERLQVVGDQACCLLWNRRSNRVV